MKKHIIRSSLSIATLLLIIATCFYFFIDIAYYSIIIICTIMPIALSLAFRSITRLIINIYGYKRDTDIKEPNANSRNMQRSFSSYINIVSIVCTATIIILSLFLSLLGYSKIIEEQNNLTVDAVEIDNIEITDFESRKSFSNFFTNCNYLSGDSSDKSIRLYIEKIENCPKWYLKYYYNKEYKKLGLTGMLGEEITVHTFDNNDCLCAYSLHNNNTYQGVSVIAMKDNDFVSIHVSGDASDKIWANEEVVKELVNQFFNV